MGGDWNQLIFFQFQTRPEASFGFAEYPHFLRESTLVAVRHEPLLHLRMTPQALDCLVHCRAPGYAVIHPGEIVALG